MTASLHHPNATATTPHRVATDVVAPGVEATIPRAFPSPIYPQLGRPTLSVVVPCHNESEVLPAFHSRLTDAMDAIGESWEVIYVNDGSRDTTGTVLARISADPRVGVLDLSRNFGKEIALTAGLDHAGATGGVVVIDADLQDPPELIGALVAKWREGFEMVYAQRRERAGETWLKRGSAHVFYRFMQRLNERVTLPADTGDFRIISRRALDALLRLREHHRFMKGLFAWIGFSSASVLYDRAPRLAGETSWNYRRLWNLAIEGITSFSVVPLKLATYLGLCVAVLALMFGGYLVTATLLFGNPVPGYPSLMAVVLFLGGVQLMTLGVIGEYLGRVFNETKQRPLYLIGDYKPPGHTLNSYGALTQ